jgi:hypothetical protein
MSMNGMYEQANWRPHEDVWHAIGGVAITALESLPDYEIGSAIAYRDKDGTVDRARTLTFVPVVRGGLRLLWPALVMNDGGQGEGYAMISDTEVVHWSDGQLEIGGDPLMQRFTEQLNQFGGALAAQTEKFQAVENRPLI